MRRYHDENLPFQCDQCTYRFSNEARLKSHEFFDHKKPRERVVEMDIERHLKTESPSNDDRLSGIPC